MEKLVPQIISQYLAACTDEEDSALAQLRIDTEKENLNYRMLSGHLQGNLLTILTSLVSTRLALEIGTFMGYSAYCIAKGLQPGAKLISVDNNLIHHRRACKFIDATPYKPQVELILDEAVNVINSIVSPLDFVFIDADKKNNINYYEMLVPKLRKGGIIIIDNVLNKGLVVEEQENKLNNSYKQLNDFIAKDKRVYKIILPLRDGLFLILKK